MNNQYKYDKDKLKESLTIYQVFDLIAELGGEPHMANGDNLIISRTICHNGHSHKLYYYENTHLFRCFTECSPEIFDIFELVLKVKSQTENNWSLPQAVHFVAQYFNLAAEIQNFSNPQEKLQDWEILNNYDFETVTTCVRVPIPFCHAVSLYIETQKDLNIDKLIEELSKEKEIEIANNINENIYPNSIEGYSSNKIFVGRIRRTNKKNGLALYLTSDNLRRGASYNAYKIMAGIIARDSL